MNPGDLVVFGDGEPRAVWHRPSNAGGWIIGETEVMMAIHFDSVENLVQVITSQGVGWTVGEWLRPLQ